MKKRRFNKKQISKCYDSKSFYKAIHMLELFESEEIVNTMQMSMNSKTFQTVESIIKMNWKKCENPFRLSEKAVRRNQMEDLIHFMPKVDDKVSDWTIAWDSIEEPNAKN